MNTKPTCAYFRHFLAGLVLLELLPLICKIVVFIGDMFCFLEMASSSQMNRYYFSKTEQIYCIVITRTNQNIQSINNCLIFCVFADWIVGKKGMILCLQMRLF